jgi:hypothetical protein
MDHKHNKTLKWLAWVVLTLATVTILKALIPEGNIMVNGSIWFVSAWLASHLTNDNVW